MAGRATESMTTRSWTRDQTGVEAGDETCRRQGRHAGNEAARHETRHVYNDAGRHVTRRGSQAGTLPGRQGWWEAGREMA